METETKVNALVEKLELDVEEARLQYENAIFAKREGSIIANQLPEFLTGINWYAFKKRDDGWYMETYYLGAEESDELVRQLRMAGAIGITSKFRGYVDSPERQWFYKGQLQVGDFTVTLMIDGGSKPPACRIEETREVKEVVTYKAICPETGEEL